MRIDSRYREQRIIIEELNKQTADYNNNESTVTDKEWDEKYFELQELEKETGILDADSPTQSIQYEVVNELNKITHEHPMLSLPKTKSIEEVSVFIGDNPYIIMSKMDGLTCSLTYENGELIRAETRGDGMIGEDILHNVKILPSIPNYISYRKKLVIDGEIICKIDDFKEFENEYANPRNFASGSIRLLNSEECAKRKLTFVAWDVIEGFEDDDDLYLLLRNIEAQGFIIVPYIFDSVQTLEEEINNIKNISEYMKYPIDGVVIKYRSRAVRASLPATSHHAGGALAYKFFDELYKSTLKGIEWSMGRTGVLTPVAIFEPIEIEGSVVERASLHNLTVMEETLGPCPSTADIVYVYKANQIIPQIAKSEKTNSLAADIHRPMTCPICDGALEVVESDVSNTKVLMCTNPECSGKLINKLDHYCGKKGLDIKGLSIATLEKLIEWEWVDSITSLYKLEQYENEWKQKTGFGPASVKKILEAIKTASTNVPLESFISALGINLIGRTNSREICKHIHTYEDFKDKINNKFDFSEYDGIAENKLYYLYNFDYTEYDELINNGYVSIEQYKNEDIEVQPLANQNIVITGSLSLYKNRSELSDEIERFGGKVSSSVSKNTTILINNDINSTSAKNKKAQELDIPIMTEQEFFNKYLENF